MICYNKLLDRKWGWNVDDVMPRRDGPENLRILKRQLVEVNHWRWWLSFSDLDRQRWIEILNITRCSTHEEGQRSMVSICFYDSYLSPRVAKAWSRKLINPFVSETIESACNCICVFIIIIIDIFMSIQNMDVFDLNSFNFQNGVIVYRKFNHNSILFEKNIYFIITVPFHLFVLISFQSFVFYL